jgi:flagellar assembly factor FliW
MKDKIKGEKRLIQSSQFGSLEIEVDYVFHFKEGILGFEELRDFVLISDEDTVPFKWLISLEEPAIGFPLLNPWHIMLEYEPGVKIDLNTEAPLVVVTLEDENGLMTANLKAPILLNVKDMSGRQIILTSDKYSTNHVISK